MEWSVEMLAPNISRQVSLFVKGVVTEQEAIGTPFGLTKFTRADPVEAAVSETLRSWLNHHVPRAAM